MEKFPRVVVLVEYSLFNWDEEGVAKGFSCLLKSKISKPDEFCFPTERINRFKIALN